MLTVFAKVRLLAFARSERSVSISKQSTLRVVHAFVSKIRHLQFSDLRTSRSRHHQNSTCSKYSCTSGTICVPRRTHHSNAPFHWLPIKHRTAYNILLIALKDLRGLAPVYIADLICVHVSPRSLRSSPNCRIVPRSCTL